MISHFFLHISRHLLWVSSFSFFVFFFTIYYKNHVCTIATHAKRIVIKEQYLLDRLDTKLQG